MTKKEEWDAYFERIAEMPNTPERRELVEKAVRAEALVITLDDDLERLDRRERVVYWAFGISCTVWLIATIASLIITIKGCK